MNKPLIAFILLFSHLSFANQVAGIAADQALSKAMAAPASEEQKKLEVGLTTFGKVGLQAVMPERFQVLVWNVHKGEDPQMLIDFSALSRDAEVSLFQEAIDAKTWAPTLAKENQTYQWNLARAFKTNGHHTGVATGSSVLPFQKIGYRTLNSEPVTNTPKTMLMTDYLMNNGEILRVLNVHGINFVLNSIFNNQVDQMVEILKDHQGPLIVAGDFNTWNAGRLDYLKKSLLKLQLSEVDFGADAPWLDHVFSRGLSVVRKNVFKEINSSDHKPLSVEFQSLN